MNEKRREKMDSNQEMFFEHLVIGSGLAGLSSALMLAEKCDGEITYQKSFALGGACFTICYPKPPAAEATSDGSISGQDSR